MTPAPSSPVRPYVPKPRTGMPLMCLGMITLQRSRSGARSDRRAALVRMIPPTSALGGTRHETADEELLHGEEKDADRQRHDHGGGHDRAQVGVELGRELGEPDRQRLRPAVV